MLTTIKIQPQMNCEFICHRIQEAIIRYQKDNNGPDLTDHLLIIDIRKPNEDDSHIPKLEYKSDQT
jgi:hypothetical protein